MTPSAVLVIKDGATKLVNIKNQDSMTKILDMVPDFVNKFTSGKGKDDEELTFEDVDFEKADDDSNKEA